MAGLLVYAIDDEPNMLYLLHEAIAEAAPDCEIEDYSLGAQALSQIQDNGARPDVVFSDIRMPGLSGLEFATRLSQISPETKLVFVTSYDYAMDAYQLHVSGYITKPVEAERVREELDILFPATATANQLRVRCFGTFEVFWQNKPLVFSRKQTKELFAYLVDRRGALCGSADVIATLWKDAADTKNMRHRVWNLTSDLRATLRSIGMEDVLVSQGGRFAVRIDLLDCDYYHMLSGQGSAGNVFRGEYMEQFSWAETTKGTLAFKRF